MTSIDLAERTRDLTSTQRRRRTGTLVALSLTFGLVQLDATIVNVALQTLRADLGGGGRCGPVGRGRVRRPVRRLHADRGRPRRPARAPPHVRDRVRAVRARLGCGYCVDWTETRHHLAGQLGRALRDHVLEAGWVDPLPGSPALKITPAGVAGIKETFGLVLEAR
jgi:hypothetical protein